MTDSQRNLLILLGIAVIGVVFSGTFNLGAGVAELLLNLAFTIMLVAFLIALYRRHSGTIATMPATPRLILQVAGAALVLLLVTGLLHAPFLPPPFGWAAGAALVFWPAVLLCAFAIWWAWQQRTSRW